MAQDEILCRFSSDESVRREPSPKTQLVLLFSLVVLRKLSSVLKKSLQICLLSLFKAARVACTYSQKQTI